MKSDLKVLLLLILLAFSSALAVTAAVFNNIVIPEINLKSMASFINVQPTGGEIIDDVEAPT